MTQVSDKTEDSFGELARICPCTLQRWVFTVEHAHVAAIPECGKNAIARQPTTRGACGVLTHAREHSFHVAHHFHHAATLKLFHH